MWPQYFIFCVYFLAFLFFSLSFILRLIKNDIINTLTTFVQMIYVSFTFYVLYAGHFFHVWGWN